MGLHRWGFLLLLLGLIGLPAACTPLPATLSPTATPTLAPSQTPSHSPTLTAPTDVIVTQWGNYRITRLQHATKAPPDCQQDCLAVAPSGYHIIIVYWQKLTGNTNPSSDDLLKSGAYLIANDSSKDPLVAANASYIAFQIPALSFAYTLYWPNNAPFPLN